jgi:hypothetical protein
MLSRNKDKSDMKFIALGLFYTMRCLACRLAKEEKKREEERR